MGFVKPRIFTAALAVTLAAALGALTGGWNAACGQSDTGRTWTYTWSAPTTGAPVAWYQAQCVANSRDTTVIDDLHTTSVTVPVDLGSDYKIRVRAFNAVGEPGPFSAWSIMETAEEAPPTNESGTAGR